MSSNTPKLQDLNSLSEEQKSVLKKNNIINTSDVILSSPAQLSKRLKLTLGEAQKLIEDTCNELATTSLQVIQLNETTDDKFTTGDAIIDETLGGGIRTGMVWEIAGESASGKTQLALQLSLLVQIRPILGGLLGAACYITTQTNLPTKRLAQLIDDHPLLSSSMCSLSDIYTLKAPTIDLLLHTLRKTLPDLQKQIESNSRMKPIRLLVIDSISSLFRSTEKSGNMPIFERSKFLTDLSRTMHTIASRDNMAIVVINEVTDVLTDTEVSPAFSPSTSLDVHYKDQARWFNSAHSLPGENSKEALLGLVWANQLNVRIILTRTNRRLYLDDSPPAKRRRIDGATGTPTSTLESSGLSQHSEQSTLLRRLSVVFSTVSYPKSVDFLVTGSGVLAVKDESNVEETDGSMVPSSNTTTTPPRDERRQGRVPVLDVSSQTFINAKEMSLTQEYDEQEGPERLISPSEVIPSTFPEEEEDELDVGYWEQFGDVTHDDMADIDFDGLEDVNVIENIRSSQALNEE